MEPRPKPHLAGSRPRGPDCRGPSTPRALGDEAESAGVRGVMGQSWGWQHPLQGLQAGVLQSATHSAKCSCHRDTF